MFVPTYDVYEPKCDSDKRREYVEVGKGLQKVDSLNTSARFEEISSKYIEGKYSSQDFVLDIENENFKNENLEEKEADIVAARITAILDNPSFSFSPVMLQKIHENLFRGVLPAQWVGQYRTVEIAKDEPILNGESVLYARADIINEQLKYDFDEEKYTKYELPFDKKSIERIARFTSNIWQTHPFREGNTRTVAVFLELYLSFLGLKVNNESFKANSKFFRDALVRSNYSDISKDIQADFKFLNMFFENLLQGGCHVLSDCDLRELNLF